MAIDKTHKFMVTIPMNTKTIKRIVPVAIIVAVIVILLFAFPSVNINIENSSKIILSYNYLDNNIKKSIFNENEIREIEILFEENDIDDDETCWCFFDKDISITFVGKNNKVTLYPALDGYSGFKIKETKKFMVIPEENNRTLIEILGRHNFILSL